MMYIKHIRQVLYRSISAMVLLAFMFASFAQAFHKHEETAHAVQEHTASIAKHVHDCAICDHFVQQHGKLFYNQPTTLLPEPAVITIFNNTGFIALNYTFTLQGFTNKGPPAQLS